jgi:hypothetical protein
MIISRRTKKIIINLQVVEYETKKLTIYLLPTDNIFNKEDIGIIEPNHRNWTSEILII